MARLSSRELTPEALEDLKRRLRRIEGQARGIQRMLLRGAEPGSILVQVAAMKAAISRVGLKLLGCQLGQSMAAEIRAGGTGDKAAGDVLSSFMRLG